MYSIFLFVGLRRQEQLNVNIDLQRNLTVEDLDMHDDPKIYLYLGGGHYSQYLEDFIYIDDLIEYDQKTHILSFDNKPLLWIKFLQNLQITTDSQFIKIKLL